MALNPHNPRGPYEKRSPEDRLFSRVNKDGPISELLGTPCWIWLGAAPNGYGSLRINYRRVQAHRLSWELANHPIPDGLHVDHLCRVTRCVNPAHLEPVTPAVNCHRGFSPPANNLRKTHCEEGHEFTPENTIVNRRSGYRNCRICVNAKSWVYRRQRGMVKAACFKGHPYEEETYCAGGGAGSANRVCRICAATE